MRSREETWKALDHGFKTFMDCLGQLTEEELTATPVVGQWTVKDVVAHVWSWADEAVHTAKAWDGPRAWQVDVAYDDAWNEAQVTGRSALALIAVVDGVTGAHRRLMHFVDLTDSEAFARPGKASWGDMTTLGEYLCDIATHYLDHVEDLKRYQKSCLECD
jgi:hypothetical protein